MDNKSNEILVPLYDENDNPHMYRLEKIFPVGEPEQMYCSAVAIEDEDVRFLKCNLAVKDGESELTIAAIESDEEYSKVVAEYQAKVMQTAVEAAKEELSERDDFITLTDEKGNKISFLVHTIFEDEACKRSYIAVQRLDDAGDIVDEIVLYLFHEENDKAVFEMIPSDMEYERARSLFMKLIEQ